jgi:hypothetical protein
MLGTTLDRGNNAANNGPCGGADCGAVANSMKQEAFNPLRQLKNKVVSFFCSNSPNGAIKSWMEVGAEKGAIFGSWGGYAALGIPSDGVGAVPGWIVGGAIGSLQGAGSGALGEAGAAVVCSAAGVYR